MRHALSGGLWLHRFVLNGEPMAHLLSSDRSAVERAGEVLGMQPQWIQFKVLKDLDTGAPVQSWHWDLLRDRLAEAVKLAGDRRAAGRGRPRSDGVSYRV